MLLVLPFCAKDGDLAIKNLEWIAELDPHLPYECLLSHDDETPAAMVERMKMLAQSVFKAVHVAWYPKPEKKYWPAAPNWAFQNAARYVAHFHPTQSWLFLEADATPIRSGWLQDIEAEHIKGGKAFTGHVVDGMGHINGSCVYPPMVAAYSAQAMQVEDTAWDVVIGATVDKEHIHNAGIGEYNGQPSRHLFQHCWNMDETTGAPTNGHGYSPTFKSAQDVVRKIDLKACIYHRCKDGSLIHWLREFYKAPHKAMVPNHTSDEADTESRNEPENKDVDNPVPRQPETERRVEAGSANDYERGVGVAPAPFTGKCEIFIVTYGLPTKRASGQAVSDFDWLTWCLRCIRKHCTGFAGITLAIPHRDAALLQPIANEHAQAKGGIPLRIKMFMEKPGKGFLMHEAVMASADEFVPKDTTHVLHVDADVMFKEAITPSEYFHGDKPVYVVRSYESLAEVRDGQKVVSDCAQWFSPTQAQLGFDPVVYSMCRHPSGFPIGFYKPYRQHIESVQGKPFIDYMLSGRNEHPADRMDFTAMGGFAYIKMRDAFEWVDISGGNHLAPRDRQQCYWSHGGITPTIQAEIEDFLK